MPLRTGAGVMVVMAGRSPGRGWTPVNGRQTGQGRRLPGRYRALAAVRSAASMPRLTRPSPTLFLCLFVSQAALLVLSPVLPEVAREGGVSAVLLAMAPRRPGLRDLLSAGTALVAAGSALSAAAPTFALLAAAQGIAGVGIGLLVAVGIAAAGEWPPAEQRAGVLSWAIAGMPAAWIMGMPLVGVVAHVSWRAAWLVPTLAALAALGLGAMAAAMVPDTFLARRHAARATPSLLAALTSFQAGAVVVLGGLRPGVAFTLAVLAAMAFANGWRSMVASALGMDAAPQDRVAVMSMRAAANQFGYLLGAAAGGVALAVADFAGLGIVLGCLFAAAVLVHAPALLPGAARVAPAGAA